MPGVCPRCLREVYFAEEKLALGKVWHALCFSCRNCRKLLDSWTVATHSGELFCRNCYSRLFSITSVRTAASPLNSSVCPPVDTKDFPVSPCASLSDRCCHHYLNEDSVLLDTRNQDPELKGSRDILQEEQRLRHRQGKQEGRESKTPIIEIGGSKDCCDSESSKIGFKNTVTNSCNSPSSTTAVTTWYNRQQSVSQSTVSRPFSTQEPPNRPSSTPASGQVASGRNVGNFNCLGTRRPGSTCRHRHNHHEYSTGRHYNESDCSPMLNRIAISQDLRNITNHCSGENNVTNYRNQSRYLERCPAMEIVTDDDTDKMDVDNVEHTVCVEEYRGEEMANNDSICIEYNGDNNVENSEDANAPENSEKRVRMRGGCGSGNGGFSCNCNGAGGKSDETLDCSSRIRCSNGISQNERRSTADGACDCSGQARSRWGSGLRPGECCSGGESAPGYLSGIGGCCSTRPPSGNNDESKEGACASQGTSIRRLSGYGTFPTRPSHACSPDSGSLSSCNAGACSPPCSRRKSCCPPAGCRPVRPRIARCKSPCTGNNLTCGGGGNCGSGCRGGCGKPGQICLPLKPCTIPPCQPHPRGGGSPCIPPRQCPPQPPCCRSLVIPGSPGNVSGSGGSGCYRSGNSGIRPTIGDECSPSMGCQHRDDGLPLGSCCQSKLPVGCSCLGGGQDCQRCGLKVYQAEMQIASGVPYHNICFSCFCCRKPLETLTYHENCGEIYCKQCYVRNFGPQGYGYSGVLQTPM